MLPSSLLPHAPPAHCLCRPGRPLKRPAAAPAADCLPVPPGMPQELLPAGPRGRLSYTVHVSRPGEAPLVVEVLIKARAFRTKLPAVTHTAWSSHPDIPAAWLAAQAAVREAAGAQGI
jgi:hypothetical protein